MNRIEAVIFASGKPVAREALLLVVGKGANIDLLIDDVQADLKSKPYEIVPVAGGWMFRTRPSYAQRSARQPMSGIKVTSSQKRRWGCFVP